MGGGWVRGKQVSKARVHGFSGIFRGVKEQDLPIHQVASMVCVETRG